MIRRTLLAGAALALALPPGTAAANGLDFSAHLPVWRIGIIGGENEADRLRRLSCLAELVTERFAIPVELYPATDYAGVMQGLIAGTLEVAGLGASAYAGIHLQDPNAVEVIVTNSNTDDSLGYYSVVVVRADSGIDDMEQLRGRSLAFADPNSASGYLVPHFELNDQGYTTDGGNRFFGQVGFSGGHEQGVIAVLNRQYDAAATWMSGLGERSDGYSRGNLRRMVDKGALDMDDIEIVWTSSLIANGPTVIRQDLPAEVKEAYTDFLVGLVDEHPDCYANLAGGDGNGYVRIDHSFYEPMVHMRRATMDARRGG